MKTASRMSGKSYWSIMLGVIIFAVSMYWSFKDVQFKLDDPIFLPSQISKNSRR